MSILDSLRESATGEKDDISELKKKLQYAKTSQARFLSTWELNRSFYAGDQWVYW
jgi:lipase chaperone LimK